MNNRGEVESRIGRVVSCHQHSMLRLAFAYVKNTADAEDIVQEVFLSFMRAAPAFMSEEHEKAWLLRSTINRCKNQFKSGWFRHTKPLIEAQPQLSAPQSELLSCVLSLQEKYRMPLHLHYYEGYSIKEIAQIISEKPATVGTRLARGRELIRQQIGGMENVR